MTDPQYETASQAKLACAERALSEGVVDTANPAYGALDPISASHAFTNAPVNHVTEDFQSPEKGLTYEEYLGSFSPQFRDNMTSLLNGKGHPGSPAGLIKKQLDLVKDPQINLSIMMGMKPGKEPGETKCALSGRLGA
jgi:hypothetical protein